MTTPLELLKGTLDILILKSVSVDPLHGYGISRRIRDATEDALQVEEGALYPALRRLESRGLLVSEWRISDTGREARFYALTARGERELDRGIRDWGRYVEAMNRVLHPGPAVGG